MAANARLARMIDSVKYNPRFALSELAADFSAGEADEVSGPVGASLVVYGSVEGDTIAS
jgi:hypothetical protein